MLGAHVGLVVSDSAIRWMTATSAVPLPLGEATFLRGVVALPGLVLVGVLLPSSGGIRIRNPVQFALRGAIMALTSVFLFLGLGLLPYAHAIGLFFVSPVLITLASVLWLRERAGRREWGALVAGASGVAVMLDPFGEAWTWAGLFPLLAAACYGCLQIMTRRTRAVAGPTEMALSGHLGIFVVSAVFGLAAGGGGLAPAIGGELGSLLLGTWILPEREHVMLALLCGAAVAVGGSLLFQAYRLAPGSTVAPLEYVQLPLAALAGFVVWGEIPGIRTLLGIGLIVAGGLTVVYGSGTAERR